MSNYFKIFQEKIKFGFNFLNILFTLYKLFFIV